MNPELSSLAELMQQNAVQDAEISEIFNIGAEIAVEETTESEGSKAESPVAEKPDSIIDSPIFARLESIVFSTAFSPDGRKIIAGLRDGTLRLFDTISGAPIDDPFQGHEDRVWSVAFSPDGKAIVSGSVDKTLRLWDLQGNPIGTPFRGHEDRVWSVAFSPDGKAIVSGSQDKTLRLWDLQGNPIGTPFRGHEDSVFSVAFSPDGKAIISGCEDKTLRLWNLQGAPIGASFLGHENRVWSVAFSPDGKAIVSGSEDKTLRLWDLQGNQIGLPFQGHKDSVFSVAFSPDGKAIISGSSDNTLRLWNLQGNQIGFPFQGHEDRVISVAFSPDGKVIVSGSEDNTLRLWDLQGKALPNLAARVKTVESTFPDSVVNDSSHGKDCLNVKDEIEALATVLMLRSLKAPVAVGILGGWGSGKSFGMNLIQQTVVKIRNQKLDSAKAWGDIDSSNDKKRITSSSLSPFVGHIYQITFNAWTYAKSDLWASLMQEIFYELNRQIALEQKIGKFLNSQKQENSEEALLEEVGFWEILYITNEDKRRDFINSNLKDFKDQKDSDSNNYLWNVLDESKDQEKESLEKSEQNLRKKEEDLQLQFKIAENEVNQQLAQRRVNAFWKPIFIAIVQILFSDEDIKKYEKVVADFAKTGKATRETFSLIRKVATSWQGLIALFVMTFLIVLILEQDVRSAIISTTQQAWIQSLREAIPASLQVLTVIAATVTTLLPALKALGNYLKAVQTEQAKIQSERDSLIKQKQQEKAKDKNLEKEIAELKLQVEEQRQRVGLTAKYSSVMDFVSDRLQVDDYGKRLGLMEQVRKDLASISDRLTDWEHNKKELKKFFPRGPIRVFLYIDDLDRCPPNRVVEVLESVQLLLNTQLFIVVLGIDDRYIARALEQVYQGVLKRGAKPSGLDYLEKIIQIPYRMRPISKATVEGYLRPQLKIRRPNAETVTEVTDKQTTAQSIAKTDSEPRVKRELSSDRNEKLPSQPIVSDNTAAKIEAIAKTIEFDEEEFQLLLNCCKHVDITPRTAKRLLNIYKILQFIWLTRSQKILPKDPPTDLDKRIVMSFLALSGRYPEYMRNLFEEIDVLFEEADCDPLEIYLDKLLKLIKPIATQSDRYAQREWRKFTNDIKRMLEPDDVEHPPKLKIDRDVFDLMLSFCFVGDIGYDPDDFETKI
ncbi:hypothetical protein H6F42_00625 [Pseudanabaena sp. FACHB-1998]|uniref:P-loop NTPase fold protein n=1 Tax=Pseudanabaena sp. FACHB-1998 TaxID=2692858 RepID=UPI0016801490|nr:P-loop NTPase fold protein [Pseudanabaena sp. FACHB-1998]MBD2175417.1 hypothetical protein [Pseudanabaena sp. FACHB-1998]